MSKSARNAVLPSKVQLAAKIRKMESLSQHLPAIELLTRWVEKKPKDHEAWVWLARHLLRSNQFGRAIKISQALLAKNPAMPEAIQLQYLLKGFEQMSGDFLDAIKSFSSYVNQVGNDSMAWTYLAACLIRLLKPKQASSILESILADEPDYVEAMQMLAMLRYSNGEADEACRLADRAAALAPHVSHIVLTRALIRSHVMGDPAETFQLYRDWGLQFIKPLTEMTNPLDPLSASERDPAKRLRIGYVSGDLRDHAIAFFMEPIFRYHDRSNVEVFVYSTGRPDAVTERIQAHVEHWHDVATISTSEMLRLVRSHRIDILVDLSGHTHGERLRVFAERAAPVQVTWMGFIHTPGIETIDYRLTDLDMDPPGNEQYYVERLFRMSRMGAYQPPEHAPLAAEPPMLSQASPMLVSLNHSRKITDRMLLLWGEILQKRPGARILVLVYVMNDEEAQALLLPRLERLGLPTDRFLLSGRLSLEEFMALGAVADVALDTSPTSGGTTTLHTLWMGLPVVTLAGNEAIQGYTASLLAALDLSKWVAVDADDYVNIALKLMDDAAALRQHRHDIRDKMRQSALMDYTARTAEIERSFRLMWINHLLGESRYLDSNASLDDAIELVKSGKALRS
jgi:predicted O-linked N-acetylglucosamine transferase (SPINDLY family)